jgi:hypothetical protein
MKNPLAFKTELSIMSNKKEKHAVNNPVAKFANEFNKSNVHVDRKKNRDRGYEKHKGKYNEHF